MLYRFVGGMGKVKLDRPTAARPEVDEERASPRTEQVARMRLAVHQLLASTPAADRAAQPAERVAEQFPVGPGQCWSPLSVANLALRVGDSIGKVRRLQIDLAQSGMQPRKCARIFGWRDLR